MEPWILVGDRDRYRVSNVFIHKFDMESCFTAMSTWCYHYRCKNTNKWMLGRLFPSNVHMAPEVFDIDTNDVNGRNSIDLFWGLMRCWRCDKCESWWITAFHGIILHVVTTALSTFHSSIFILFLWLSHTLYVYK